MTMRRVLLDFKLPTFTQIKDASVAALVAASTVLVGVGLVKTGLSDAIGFEPLQVPGSFTDRGYTQAISTTRLVDEIKKINSGATTTKSRSAVSGKAPGEELNKISSLPMPAGIDIKAIQDAVRELLGISQRLITGDITIVGKPEDLKYYVRIRMEPQGLLLVDAILEGEPDQVLKSSALKIIEKIDPVVAASYFRNNKNIPEALRCIDLALTNEKSEDDTFALSQRAQIYQAQKKYALAKADLDELLKLDPNSPQGLGVQSYWYNDQKMFKEGLAYAEMQMKVRPDMWHAYFNKADALIGMGVDAEKEMLDGLSHQPNKGWAYVDTADYLAKKGKNEQALQVLKTGVSRFPNSYDVNFAYGKRLLGDGHSELALHYLSRAYQLDKNNAQVWPVLLSAIPELGNEPLRQELKSRMDPTAKK